MRATQRLSDRGFEAFLVGGCVRDLLLGRTPKDYDIATEARPPQVKRTFPRNCRIIGRRFKLAHLHFHGNTKILEVSTFRRTPQTDSADDDLLITRDNEFGTAEEDALRRDFTVNALFLDPTRDCILDFANGLADVEARVIRTIGDPRVRFREDPVRILRAAKFAGRLGFQVERDTLAAMAETAPDLVRAAPPRVLEEIQRLLRGGHALDSFQLLRDVGALRALLPVLADFLGSAPQEQRVVFWRILEALDHKVHLGGVPSNPVLLGALFTCAVDARVTQSPGRSPSSVAEELLGPLAQTLRLPRRDAGCLKRICGVQHRFVQLGDAQRFKVAGFVHGPYFAEALQLFELRALATGLDPDLVHEWQQQQRAFGGAPERHFDGERLDESRVDESLEHESRQHESRQDDRAAPAESHNDSERLTADGTVADRDQRIPDQQQLPADGEPDTGGGRRRRRRRRRGRRRDRDDAAAAPSATGAGAEDIGTAGPESERMDAATIPPGTVPWYQAAAEVPPRGDADLPDGEASGSDADGQTSDAGDGADTVAAGDAVADGGEAASAIADAEGPGTGRRRRRRRRRGRRDRQGSGPEGSNQPFPPSEPPSPHGDPNLGSQARADARPQHGPSRHEGRRPDALRPDALRPDAPRPDAPRPEQAPHPSQRQGQPRQGERDANRDGGRHGRRRDRDRDRNGRRHGGPRDVDVVPRHRDRRGKVEVLEPPPLDLSAFDVELDPKRVPTFGSIVEGAGHKKRRSPKPPGDGLDDYRPPPPPGSGTGPDAPPPPPPSSSEPDTFGDW